ALVHAIEPGEPTPGSDNGSAFTARRFKQKLAELGIRHRRGGYRDPERQALTRAGSGNPNNGSYGRTSTRRSTTHDPASAATPTATTTDPTRGPTTGHRSRCARPGKKLQNTAA